MIEWLSSSYGSRHSSRRPPPRPRRHRRRTRRTPVVALAIVVGVVGVAAYASTRSADVEDVREKIEQAIDAADGGGNNKPEPLRHFTIVATGDFLPHEAVLASAMQYGNGTYDFRPMLEPIRGIISAADLAVCHQEIPISETNENITAYPIFNAPKQLAAAIEYAGYDACSTASNHSLDQGSDGIASTLRMLERRGIRTEGTNRGPSEDGHATLIPVNGVIVGWLSYTYGLNGLEGEPYEVNVLNVPEMLKRARDARRRGAEYVFASIHWGAEFQSTPTEDQIEAARRLLRSPAIDLIVGHHVHVPQPITRIGKEYVFFGLGNILSNQRAGVTSTCCPAESQDGLIADIEVREVSSGRFKTKVSYTPTWVEPGTYRVLPVATYLNDPETPSDLRTALEASWARTMSVVKSMGAARFHIRPTERPTAD